MTTSPFVLPEDIKIIPLTELPPQLRSQVQGADEDYAVTRPRSRVPSKVIDAQAAELLREFQKPSTLVEAILRFSKVSKRQPTQILEEAYPFLESCLTAKLLVEPGSESEAIRPSFENGAVVAGFRVEECVQVLSDSELYRVRSGEREAALKIARPGTGSHLKHSFRREADILTWLKGGVAPLLLGSGTTEDGREYLVLEWIAAERCGEAAAAMRASAREPLPAEILQICTNLLDAYATLHGAGIVHSDVHSNNALVQSSGEVCLIDYGLARKEGDDQKLAAAPRGGVPFFFDPEYAAAALSKSRPPQSTFASDQYSVAALVYFLLSGNHYLDFSFGREEMLRQIVEEPPVSLAARGFRGAGPIEEVLLRGLSKESSARFASTSEMAAAFRNAVNSIKPVAESAASELVLSDQTRLATWMQSILDQVSDPAIDLPVAGIGYPTASLTYGSAGIACGLFRIACVREDAAIFALADQWLDRACREVNRENGFYHPDVQISEATVGRISPYHTPSGVACVQALLAHGRGDLSSRAVSIERFLQLTDEECSNPDITLGGCSRLLALSLLVDALGWDSSAKCESLLDAGNALLETLWQQFDAMPAIADSSPSTGLAMAHGWAGYLYATLRWMQSSQRPAPQNLDSRLQQLADQACWQGARVHWSYQKGQGRPALGGWCNGSAGFVFLWTMAHRLLREPEYLRLAKGAAQDSWHYPQEGHTLCCGLTGKAYGQLNLYKLTGDKKWLDAAIRMTGQAIQVSERAVSAGETRIPLSLYKGDLGLAVLIADLECPESAAMPFFEDEAWPAAKGHARIHAS